MKQSYAQAILELRGRVAAMYTSPIASIGIALTKGKRMTVSFASSTGDLKVTVTDFQLQFDDPATAISDMLSGRLGDGPNASLILRERLAELSPGDTIMLWPDAQAEDVYPGLNCSISGSMNER